MDFTIIFDGLGSELRNTTLAAAALSVAMVAVFAWWFAPGWPLLAGYALLAVIATLSVPILYRLSGQTLADEVQWLEQREAAEHAEMTARLGTVGEELGALGVHEGRRQAETLRDLLADYHAVVETRFMGSRSGPIEYLTTARRVQKLAVQNLTDMVAVSHSLGSLTHGSADDQPEPGAEASRRERREAQISDQQERLNGLLEENRQLFDALSDTAVEVANISSFSRYEKLDTLARLTSLAEIANQRGA